MGKIVIIALAVACAFAFVQEAYAAPSDIATTVQPPKEPKEPKNVKEAGTASKDLKDVMKAGKEAKKSKKDCARECGTVYDPICVHDPADPSFKPRTFGSLCALEVHNCEMGTKWAVKSKGECPGSGCVRLS